MRANSTRRKQTNFMKEVAGHIQFISLVYFILASTSEMIIRPMMKKMEDLWLLMNGSLI